MSEAEYELDDDSLYLDDGEPGREIICTTPEEIAAQEEVFAAVRAVEAASEAAYWTVGPAEVHRAASERHDRAYTALHEARKRLLALCGLFSGKYDQPTPEATPEATP